MGLRRKGEGLVSWVVLYPREAGIGGWRGAADGGALGDIGCWATRDGRESLESISLALESRKWRVSADYLPEDLQGYGMRFLDRIVGGIALVAHFPVVITLSFGLRMVGILSKFVSI